MLRILVIDDDPSIRCAVSLHLEINGFEVRQAESGLSGVAEVEAHEFDVVIADVCMPGMDGIETIQALRKCRPELPIIVMSGMGSSGALRPVPDFLAMAVKFGATKALYKPFTAAELIQSVHAVSRQLATH